MRHIDAASQSIELETIHINRLRNGTESASFQVVTMPVLRAAHEAMGNHMSITNVSSDFFATAYSALSAKVKSTVAQATDAGSDVFGEAFMISINHSHDAQGGIEDDVSFSGYLNSGGQTTLVEGKGSGSSTHSAFEELLSSISGAGATAGLNKIMNQFDGCEKNDTETSGIDAFGKIFEKLAGNIDDNTGDSSASVGVGLVEVPGDEVGKDGPNTADQLMKFMQTALDSVTSSLGDAVDSSAKSAAQHLKKHIHAKFPHFHPFHAQEIKDASTTASSDTVNDADSSIQTTPDTADSGTATTAQQQA